MLQAELGDCPSGESTEGAPTEPGADRAERLLAGLNEPQREAVRHGEGPLLVLAGAGSGKTRVLTHRIAYLLATGAARPGEILAITFTNKAATEMRERVEELVGRSARAMWVTTFHSACARMLRADAERLGYSRGFTIYDESDSLRMLKRCMDELEVDPKRYPPRAIRSQISGAKNQLVDADAYAEAQGSVFEETVAEVFALYEKRMLEANAMDFDDLLVRTVNVLELFEEVRERWRRTFRHVLVDEYQDTNHAQYRLLQLLTAEHGNLMVVGDEDQSIYGFRHADIRNILDFERDFPEAEVVKLEQNYRSTQTILSAANAVVERNRQRRPKRLWTEIAGGEPVQLSELGRRARGGALGGGGDRAARRGGGRRPRGRRGLLPDQRDEPGAGGHAGPLRAALPGDRRHQVLRAGRDQGRGRLPQPAGQPRRPGLLRPRRQLAAARDRQHQPGAARLPRQHHRLADLGGGRAGRGGAGAGRGGDQGGLPLPRDDGGPARAGRRRRPSPSCSRRCCARRGYLEALAAERTVEAEGRVENLEELVGVAAEFDVNRELEGESEVPPLEEFLQQISLYTEQDELDDDESLITLMTLHNAKGLEYDTVFIVGCEDGAFPHMRALEEGGEEEERRLCYVGITRARQRLYMTWARERRLFGRCRAQPALALRRRAAGRADRAPLRAQPAAAESAGTPGSERVARLRSIPGPTLELQTGDDVVHASFGDGRRDRGRAGGRGRRPLRRRRLRAQADGRLRADPEAVARWRPGSSTARRSPPRCASGSPAEVAAFVAEAGRAPALATVIVGEDPASEIYVRNKHRACEEVGMRSVPPRPRRPTERGRAAGAGRASSGATTRSTASSSSCRCPTRSTPTRSSPRSIPARTSTA